jgi:hypothetical protein
MMGNVFKMISKMMLEGLTEPILNDVLMKNRELWAKAFRQELNKTQIEELINRNKENIKKYNSPFYDMIDSILPVLVLRINNGYRK